MLRHGEGAWNKENRFCSWVDQKLNNEGMEEARNCGKQLKALNFEFDLVFTSVLNRSIHTAWLILEELGQEWVPVESSWRLNERHYGALIGLNREKMALNHGEEQVKLWRRSYSVTPPPIEESHPYYHEIYNDRRYKVCDVPADQLPRSESLKDVLERLLPFWNERIAPEVLSGKTILISAHGNSSRALLKHLEGTVLCYYLLEVAKCLQWAFNWKGCGFFAKLVTYNLQNRLSFPIPFYPYSLLRISFFYKSKILCLLHLYYLMHFFSDFSKHQEPLEGEPGLPECQPCPRVSESVSGYQVWPERVHFQEVPK